jgi:hypothetical protein
MSKQIVLAASEECVRELEAMGFKKTEVWMKDAPGMSTADQKAKGEAEIRAMNHKPYMFLVSSWWGMGFE